MFPSTQDTTTDQTYNRWTALNRGQQPDEYQARLIELVKEALTAGKFYNTDVNRYVQEHSAGFIPAEAWDWQYKGDPVEGGIMGYETYCARRYIRFLQERADDTKAVERYPAGTQLGTLCIQGKRFTGAVVKEIHSRDALLAGKRGRCSATITCSPRHILDYIATAVRRGWRKA